MIPYNRRDYESIFEYLKEQAIDLSDNKWTDWSEGDIGAVLVHLMSYLGDMNNAQIDITAAELFLSTAVERSSLMEICKLIGYEPKHYISATAEVTIGFGTAISSGSTFYENTLICTADELITYSTIEATTITDGIVKATFYEGAPASESFSYSSITTDGKIYLSDYNVGMNTIRVRISTINSNEPIVQLDDVRFNTGSIAFSAHVSLDERVYIQLPSFWKDLMDTSAVTTVSYNKSNGTAGTIGENTLTKFYKASNFPSNYDMENEASTGGSDPEDVATIKKLAPVAAKTMYTCVTKQDFDDVAQFVSDVAQTKSFDYLDGNPPSGDEFPFYTQPDDYYKLLMLAVPYSSSVSTIFQDGEQTKWYGEGFDADVTQEDSIFNATGLAIKEYIDERRLASLKVTYSDPEYIMPSVELDIYVDKDDSRIDTVAFDTVTYIKIRFGRAFTGIGQPIYGSVIGKEVLNALSHIEYLEVAAPARNIPCEEWQYIDMANAEFIVRVNDEPVELPTLYTDMARFEMVKGDTLTFWNPDSQEYFDIEYFTQAEYLADNSIIPSNFIPAFVMKFTILYVPNEWLESEGS